MTDWARDHMVLLLEDGKLAEILAILACSQGVTFWFIIAMVIIMSNKVNKKGYN